MPQIIIPQARFSVFRAPMATSSPERIGELTVGEIGYLIRSDTYKLKTQYLRSLKTHDSVKEFKRKHLDYFCPTGIFRERKDDALVMNSGRLCFDLDHLDEKLYEIREKLLNDKYFETDLLWVSPSGTGLKWMIDVTSYLEEYGRKYLYIQILNYLKKEHSLTDEQADSACSNCSRAPFLCWDENCYINNKYKISDYYGR